MRALLVLAAWNRNDILSLVACWTDDATVINPRGRVAHGRQQLLAFFAEEHAAAGATVEKLAALDARPLADGLAWVDADLTVEGAGRPPAKFHLVGLVRRQGGRWLWAEGRPYAIIQ